MLLSLRSLFISSERKGVSPEGRAGGEELGGVEGAETVLEKKVYFQ